MSVQYIHIVTEPCIAEFFNNVFTCYSRFLLTSSNELPRIKDVVCKFQYHLHPKAGHIRDGEYLVCRLHWW